MVGATGARAASSPDASVCCTASTATTTAATASATTSRGDDAPTSEPRPGASPDAGVGAPHGTRPGKQVGEESVSPVRLWLSDRVVPGACWGICGNDVSGARAVAAVAGYPGSIQDTGSTDRYGAPDPPAWVVSQSQTPGTRIGIIRQAAVLRRPAACVIHSR
jgi:hypothetical protein